MQPRGVILVRVAAALLAIAMAGCLVLFAVGKVLSAPMIAAYMVAVLACATFATPWPWHGNTRSRFYALLGVLWTSAAAGALIRDLNTVTATLYGVAAALSFWAALTSRSSRSGSADETQRAK